jgi:hypothetical protein
MTLGWSIPELAERVGVVPRVAAAWERGDTPIDDVRIKLLRERLLPVRCNPSGEALLSATMPGLA